MSDETRPGETAVDGQIEKLLTDADASPRRPAAQAPRARRSIARRH